MSWLPTNEEQKVLVHLRNLITDVFFERGPKDKEDFMKMLAFRANELFEKGSEHRLIQAKDVNEQQSKID